jgi:hypothetical protein
MQLTSYNPIVDANVVAHGAFFHNPERKIEVLIQYVSYLVSLILQAEAQAVWVVDKLGLAGISFLSNNHLTRATCIYSLLSKSLLVK